MKFDISDHDVFNFISLSIDRDKKIRYRTSCYSNGSESPHRCGVTLLLRAIVAFGGSEDWARLLSKGYLICLINLSHHRFSSSLRIAFENSNRTFSVNRFLVFKVIFCSSVRYSLLLVSFSPYAKHSMSYHIVLLYDMIRQGMYRTIVAVAWS